MTPLEIRIFARFDHYLPSAFTADKAGKTYNTNSSRENEQTNEMETTPLQNMDGIQLQLLETKSRGEKQGKPLMCKIDF